MSPHNVLYKRPQRCPSGIKVGQGPPAGYQAFLLDVLTVGRLDCTAGDRCTRSDLSGSEGQSVCGVKGCECNQGHSSLVIFRAWYFHPSSSAEGGEPGGAPEDDNRGGPEFRRQGVTHKTSAVRPVFVWC
ncbi:MAG: hypothetical protein ABSH49_13315 [Bryobacteraceae bacterium]